MPHNQKLPKGGDKMLPVFCSIGGAVCFCFGILIMGSDTWMPWSQLIGAVIFLGTLFFAKLGGLGK